MNLSLSSNSYGLIKWSFLYIFFYMFYYSLFCTSISIKIICLYFFIFSILRFRENQNDIWMDGLLVSWVWCKSLTPGGEPKQAQNRTTTPSSNKQSVMRVCVRVCCVHLSIHACTLHRILFYVVLSHGMVT